MRYRVSEVRQTSGGGDYVVKYEAEIELLSSEAGIKVEVASTVPPDADSAQVDAARECIYRGAFAVLAPRRQGAILRLSRLFIHPVDFRPQKTEEVTSRELLRALEASLTDVP